MTFVAPLVGLRLVLALKDGRKIELHHHVATVRLLCEYATEFLALDLLQPVVLLLLLRWLVLTLLEPQAVLAVRSLAWWLTVARA